METKDETIGAVGLRFQVQNSGKEIARAYLYILTNRLHSQPFGFMEDVMVDEDFRGKGIGSKLVNTVIEEARKRGCYKLICTARYEKPKVQDLYISLGFKEQGKEFRIDF